MQLIVVGFHRSGTSLLTQLLHASGLFVGDRLLGAMPSNPYGHFEDREVLDLHRVVMADHGYDWQIDEPHDFHIAPAHWRHMQRLVQKRQTQHRNWGFKDPRACLFLGAWKYLLPDARFVMIYREPADSVQSLERRHGEDYHRESGPPEEHLRFFTEPDHGLKMWDTHNRAIVSFARMHLDDCLVVPFTHLRDGYPVMRRINQRFDGDLDELPTEAVFDARATARGDERQHVHDSAVADSVRRTWTDLEELTALTEAS